MTTEQIGILSGALVVLSAIPYAFRTYQGVVKPNITSWSLWGFIGLALLVTYEGSGAKDNVWPAVFGFTNPCIIALLAIWRRGDREKMTNTDKWCFVFGLVSLGVWFFVRESRELVQFALYLAIVADLFAAVPTIVFVWGSPHEDRPGAWGLYAIGYGLAIFAISEPTFANYALPVYMLLGASSISLILAAHRVRERTPLKEWI